MLGHESLLALALACAPMIDPETALRLVKQESGGNPYAIGINGPYRLSHQPTTKAQAVSIARTLIDAGVSVDMGLGMINSSNMRRLNVTLGDLFDPCANLRAMQQVLGQNYARAVKRRGPGQQALQEALSEYNTGSPTRGMHNGYVGKIYGQSQQTPGGVKP